ncbi:MAG: hypothetical protein HND44_05975 [Chloroflexi bacterium]|nr:hypothetical protein [Ardenticatenaceae bacterium]MBL1128036.1 hypothetical protein [Chloroflexota bacterium]NOG34108.1 hypothetical protein [Chloroflexota bacterium]GIK56893.1 MAG: hypothetical protein BroJett015_25560 [Chloroflexota bacterium]
MQPLSWIILGILIVVLVLLVAYLFYKSGFRLTELKLKWGIGEASMKREPGDKKAPAVTAEKLPGPGHFSQQTSDGGVVEGSHIKAPANAPVEVTQEAKGEGSKVKNSRIELE